MWGKLAGVTTVVSTCVLLLAKIQSLSEVYFAALALVGGSHLLWIAYRLWMQPARFTGGTGVRRRFTTERDLANLNKVAAGLMVLVAALMLFRI